jgi:glutamate 5-kinase
VEGEFDIQEAVQLCDRAGNEIARGLVNYDSAELRKIQGQQSHAIAQILGYKGVETVIHRDNLVLM